MPRKRFPHAVSVLAAAGVLLGLFLAAPSSAAANKKLATVTPAFSQGDVAATAPLAPKTDYTFSFTLKNISRSPQSFGSAMITVPSGFVVGETTIQDGTTSWPGFSVTRVGGSTAGPIVLTSSTSSGVPVGSSLTITVPVTTPQQACDTTWTTEVKQSNDFSGPPGNDFTISGDQPTSPLQGGVHLAWMPAYQPSDVQHDMTMTPAPAVALYDACGNVVTTYGGTVTASDYTREAATATTFQATASAGVATFTDISYSAWGDDHYLVATGTDPAPTSCDVTTDCKSATFHVYEVLKTCGAKACSSLTQSGPLDETLASVDATSGTAGDKLKLDIGGDPNANLGAGSEFDPCAATSGRDIAYGEVVKFDVENRSKTVTMTLPKQYVNEISNNGTPFMDICLVLPADSPDAFFDKFHYTDPQPTDAPVTTGLLPDCAWTGNDPPCITQRQKRAANEIITFVLDPGDPHTSWF